MQKLAGQLVRIVFAGGVLCACRHPSALPIASPIPRETKPIGQKPDIAKPPLGTPGAAALDPLRARLGATNAAVMVDAGIDAATELPPLSDASSLVVPDAGTPMR